MDGLHALLFWLTAIGGGVLGGILYRIWSDYTRAIREESDVSDQG